MMSWNKWPGGGGEDLAPIQTGISSGVGYFWTTQENTLPLTENPKNNLQNANLQQSVSVSSAKYYVMLAYQISGHLGQWARRY